MPITETVDSHYEPAVDGLRAVAVVAVMLFHAGIDGFRGGFVGVDVFFVISGYLITRIIRREMLAGNFSIITFYERRARRILPALFLVLATCLPAAWFWLSPVQHRDFSQSLAAVSVFASNILFWLKSGYFDPIAETRPLLHTWSLGVEEQFYLLFPLLLISLRNFSATKLVVALSAFAAISLALAQWGGMLVDYLTTRHMEWQWADVPSWAFYLAPTRAWELLLGAIAALLPLSKVEAKNRGLRQALAYAGLLLIGGAIYCFNEATPFPGATALLPNIGTILVIRYADQLHAPGRLLCSNSMVTAGLLSYSAYLWHQPMFVLARALSVTHPPSYLFVIIGVAAFALAWPTRKYVEQPWRNRQNFKREHVFAFALVGSLAFLGIGLAGHLSDGFSSRFSGAQLSAFSPAKARVGGCGAGFVAGFPGITQCPLGTVGPPASVILYGDSHADALSTALAAALRQRGLSGLLVKNEHCSVIPDIYDGRKLRLSKVDICQRAHHALIEGIRQSSATSVWIVGRWTTSLYPVKNHIDQLAFDNGEGGVEKDLAYRENFVYDNNLGFTQDAEAKRLAVKNLVASMHGTGKEIVLIYPSPEVGWNIPEQNFKSFQFQGKQWPQTVSTSYQRYTERNAFAIAALDAVHLPGITRIKPAEILCNTWVQNRCVAQWKGRPLYYDDDHLSEEGASLLVRQIMNTP